jgi:wyosine [tRNA(Phe)-imidazoG37] synthetase (radical SAM superfamily)
MIAFGPIPSRRLGISLGINNIASQKICSYSCVYCQIGLTRKQSIHREVFYEPEKLVLEVEKHLVRTARKHIPDYLTFVANGEPTLDINLGKEIHLLKKLGIPIAVITNSSLIYDQQVQEELMNADWVSVKVDTVSDNVWKSINQPCQTISLDNVLHGLQIFSSAYSGKLHTETMLLDGKDSTSQLKQTAEFIATINPLKAYLSIPTRPPALTSIRAVSEEGMTEAWQIFHKEGIRTELLNGFEGTGTGTTGNAFEDILNITAVHPLREDTMAALLEQDKVDGSVVKSLISQGLIKDVNYNGKVFYVRSFHLKK